MSFVAWRRTCSSASKPGFYRHHLSLVARKYSTEPNRSQDHPNSDPVADALRNGSATASALLAPVHIPEDPDGILQAGHPASSILAHSSIIIHRQLEMMNVMMGFEQANKYVVLDPQGAHIGYMAEQDLGMGKAMTRQLLRTRRAFQTHVFDRGGREVLRFHRPFQFINSTIRVFDPVDPAERRNATQDRPQGSVDLNDRMHDVRPSMLPIDQMGLIGLAQQQWAPLRRKYNLFVADNGTSPSDQPRAQGPQLAQFAFVDEPFLSWDFSFQSPDSSFPIGSVNRNFVGFGRELFTDTGVYALRMDAAAVEAKLKEEHEAQKHASPSSRQVDVLPDKSAAMTLDERAVMLATAVSVDFDYFSRSRGGFMPMPLWLGGASAEGAGAGTAAGAGALEGAGAAGGTVARGAAGGAVENAAVGAGTMAGYEAMQRGYGNRGGDGDDASPMAPDQGQAPSTGQSGGQPQQPQEDVWGTGQDPWANDQDSPWQDSNDQRTGQDPGSETGGDGDAGDILDWF